MRRLIFIALLFLTSYTYAQFPMVGSGRAVYRPDQVDSLFYWFDAQDISTITTTNNKVTAWNDKSGNDYHVTQADTSKAPTYSATSGPGGSTGAMTFDGTDDFLASAAHFWGSDDITVFVVMKFANATRDTFNFVLTRWNYTNAKRQWQFSTGNNTSDPPNYRPFFRTVHTVTSGKIYQIPDGSNTAFALHSISVNGSGTETWAIDGASKVVTETNLSGTYAIQDATDYLLIGTQNFPSPGLYARISISEIIVFSRAITNAERQGIEAYLSSKYNLALQNKQKPKVIIQN